MNTLDTLEKATHGWSQARREELGRIFGIGWTALRYHGTGSMEGLEFLYPFLNDSDVHVRRKALAAVGAIFEGVGAAGVDKLEYVTANRDLFIRDRAALVLGSALVGESPETILDVLLPSYTHKSDFIRGLGTMAVGLAGLGRGCEQFLSLFEERVADRSHFVVTNAIHGLGAAFADTGDPRALALLEPFSIFPVVDGEFGKGQSWRTEHFRLRYATAHHRAGVLAIVQMARGSSAQAQAASVTRRQLTGEDVPSGADFGCEFSRRIGVHAMTWLLRSKPREALEEMGFILPPPAPDEPEWLRRIARSGLIWTLPGVFKDAGEEGVNAARSLLEAQDHPALRTGMLALGIAARGTGDEDCLAGLAPFLSHGNGAVRDAAVLAVGFLCQATQRADVHELLKSTNGDNDRGPGTNYPLGLGLVFQGTGDESVANELIPLAALGRRRLSRHVALAIGLIYQGTGDAKAVDVLMPLLESRESGFGCEALQLADFDDDTLAHAPLETLPRCHALADGPGAARMFVLQHFLTAEPHFAWA